MAAATGEVLGVPGVDVARRPESEVGRPGGAAGQREGAGQQEEAAGPPGGGPVEREVHGDDHFQEQRGGAGRPADRPDDR